MTPTELLATLTRLGVEPVSLRIEWPIVVHTEPQYRLQLRTRTDFQQVTTELRMKTASSDGHTLGQVRYWTASDGPLLIEAVSFPHHEDWPGKPQPAPVMVGGTQIDALDELAEVTE